MAEVRRRRWQLALRWGGTLLAFAALLYLLSVQGWVEIWRTFSRVPAWRLAAALGLTLISRLAVSGRWHVLLRTAGLPIPWADSLRITFAGLFASNFLPTTIGGDVVRLAGALALGYDRAISLSSLVVDRLVGMAGMALAAPLVLLYLPLDFLAGLGFTRLYGLMGVGIVFGSVWQRVLGQLRQAWGSLWGALTVWFRQPGGLLLALLCTGLHMLATFLTVWLLLPGLGDVAPLPLIAGLWSLAYFVTLLPVSINGLGVQELSLTFFFTTWGGISIPASLSLALLMRVLPLLVSLLGAFSISQIFTPMDWQTDENTST